MATFNLETFVQRAFETIKGMKYKIIQEENELADEALKKLFADKRKRKDNPFTIFRIRGAVLENPNETYEYLGDQFVVCVPLTITSFITNM